MILIALPLKNVERFAGRFLQPRKGAKKKPDLASTKGKRRALFYPQQG
jgi:hypothetical protein